MEAATVTFNEAVPHPYCGIYTKKSHISHSFAESPVPYNINLFILWSTGQSLSYPSICFSEQMTFTNHQEIIFPIHNKEQVIANTSKQNSQKSLIEFYHKIFRLSKVHRCDENTLSNNEPLSPKLDGRLYESSLLLKKYFFL